MAVFNTRLGMDKEEISFLIEAIDGKNPNYRLEEIVDIYSSVLFDETDQDSGKSLLFAVVAGNNEYKGFIDPEIRDLDGETLAILPPTLDLTFQDHVFEVGEDTYILTLFEL